MAEIKVWKLNDCDWVAARTLDEAKRCLCDLIEGTGLPITKEFEDDYIESPYALEDAELNTLTICDEDEPRNKALQKTFRQSLEEMKVDGKTVFPCHFATTEY